MKTAIDFSWTKNLYEVGAPIRDAAKEIAWDIERADAALADAQKRHMEAIDGIKTRALALKRNIESLWSDEEIEAAKRGEMLVR